MAECNGEELKKLKGGKKRKIVEKSERGIKKNYKNSVKIASVFFLCRVVLMMLSFGSFNLLVVAAVRLVGSFVVQQVGKLVAILKHLPKAISKHSLVIGYEII